VSKKEEEEERWRHCVLSPVDVDGLVELPVRHAARMPE
jgi:hypothetical protein